MRIAEIKFLLLTFCVACLIFAIAFIKILCTDLMKYKNDPFEEESNVLRMDIALIVLLSIVLSVVFIGACGSLMENVKILYAFSLLLTLMIIIEVVLSVYCAVFRSWLEQSYTEYLNREFHRSVTLDQQDDYAELWKNVHQTYECCGLDGPQDFEITKTNVPISCCPSTIELEGINKDIEYVNCLREKTFFKEGCEKKYLRQMSSTGDWLLGLGLGLFISELASVAFALWQANRIEFRMNVLKSHFGEEVKF